MIAIILTLGAILAILLSAEAIRKQERWSNEKLRKFVHISVGVLVSTWPFYLSILTIELLCLAMIGAVLVSKYFNIFRSVHSIDRKTWGDVLFPLGIGLTVMIAQAPWVFTVAMLHLSVADGAAALAGKRSTKSRNYNLLGQNKSVIGTLVFWLVSVLIISVVVIAERDALGYFTLPLLFWLPAVATLLENASPQGLDNLIVPFAVAVSLNLALAFA